MTRQRRDGTGTLVVPIHVVEADAPRRFVFRWVHPADQPATPRNSFLVTFELVPANGGTLWHLTEAGFREIGWEAAQLEQRYRSHSAGWDEHLPNLPAYAAGLVRSVIPAIDDELWAAIGDPTRRRLLDLLLADGSGTATSLSGHLPVTRQAVAKHLGVLERAELVVPPQGRPRACAGTQRSASVCRAAAARTTPAACGRVRDRELLVQHDVRLRPGAAHEHLAGVRGFQRIGGVRRGAGQEWGHARVAHARPARPAGRHVARLGQFQQ